MAKYVILIEGNICAGKTSLTNYLRENNLRLGEFVDDGEVTGRIVEALRREEGG